MGRSQALRDSDVQAMLNIVAGIAGLPPDPTIRTQHALQAVSKLIHASASFTTRLRDDGPSRRVEPYAIVHHGFTPRELQARIDIGQDDPIHKWAMEAAAAAGRDGIVFLRDRLDTQHRRARAESAERNLCEAAGDMNLMIITPLAQDNHYTALALNRSPDDKRAFSDREMRMAAMVWRSLMFIHNAPLAAVEPRLWGVYLSPSLQKVFEHLLTGQGIKQIARQTNLSIYTVRDYTKEIYRRFGAAGRSELQAMFTSHDQTPIAAPSKSG